MHQEQKQDYDYRERQNKSRSKSKHRNRKGEKEQEQIQEQYSGVIACQGEVSQQMFGIRDIDIRGKQEDEGWKTVQDQVFLYFCNQYFKVFQIMRCLT